MNKEDLIYEINGKRYILIEMPIIVGLTKEVKEFCDKYGMVFQGVKDIHRGGLFGKTVIINKLLLPEENFEAYSKDKI